MIGLTCQVLATASQRLIELSGENTLPDETSIGKCQTLTEITTTIHYTW